MTSRAWSVRSKITLRTSLVTLVRNKSHLIVELYRLWIWSTSELRYFWIAKVTRSFISKIFSKSEFRKSGAEMRQSIYMSLNIKIKKTIHDTLFKAFIFYFHTKWLSNKVQFLTLKRNTRYGNQDDLSDKALHKKTETLYQIKIWFLFFFYF